MNCKNCGEPIKKYNKFCNSRCSAIYNNKIRKLSNYSVKNLYKIIYCSKCNLDIVVPINTNNNGIFCKSCKEDFVYIQNKKCVQCNENFNVEYLNNTKHIRKYCDACLLLKNRQSGSKGGLKSISIQSVNRRSKNEIYFAELCSMKFNVVKTNESIFDGWDADVIIEDLKIAILWNGKWHYEKITKSHSVLQVQNRDRIKIEKIKICGYIPYVIQDLGKYNPKFVDDEFKKFCNLMGV